MSGRSRRETKSIDYSRLGLEGSIKQQAMTMKDGENDGILSKETLPETEVTGDGTDPTEAGAMAREAEKQDGTDDDDVLISEKEIDAKMQAAEQEKKRLSDQIRIQKKLRMLDKLERENRRLRDELSSVTQESEAARTAESVLRAPSGGARQHCSGCGKLRQKSERNWKKTTKVKAKSECADREKPKRTVMIGDLRDNLAVNAEADRALRVLGVSATARVEPSDSSESEGPKSRVKHTSKCRDRRRQSNHCCSKLSHGKTGKSKFTGLSSDSDSDSDTESKVQWPNDNLGPRYNNFGKAEVKFRQLDLRLLVAGELNIVCQGGVSEMEKEARLRLLGDIVFYSAHYQWPALLKSEVEKGAPGWGYDYSRLEQQMLMPFPMAKNKGERKVERVNRPASAANGGGKPDERVVYCGEFQNGSCTLQDNHGGKFFGQSVVFQHICATCWKELKHVHTIRLHQRNAHCMSIDSLNRGPDGRVQ